MSVVWIRGQFQLRGVWLSYAFSNYFCCYIYEDKVCIDMVFHQYASSCVDKLNKVSSWLQHNFYMDIPRLHLWSLLALSAKKIWRSFKNSVANLLFEFDMLCNLISRKNLWKWVRNFLWISFYGKIQEIESQ